MSSTTCIGVEVPYVREAWKDETKSFGKVDEIWKNIQHRNFAWTLPQQVLLEGFAASSSATQPRTTTRAPQLFSNHLVRNYVIMKDMQRHYLHHQAADHVTDVHHVPLDVREYPYMVAIFLAAVNLAIDREVGSESALLRNRRHTTSTGGGAIPRLVFVASAGALTQLYAAAHALDLFNTGIQRITFVGLCNVVMFAQQQQRFHHRVAPKRIRASMSLPDPSDGTFSALAMKYAQDLISDSPPLDSHEREDLMWHLYLNDSAFAALGDESDPTTLAAQLVKTLSTVQAMNNPTMKGWPGLTPFSEGGSPCFHLKTPSPGMTMVHHLPLDRKDPSPDVMKTMKKHLKNRSPDLQNAYRTYVQQARVDELNKLDPTKALLQLNLQADATYKSVLHLVQHTDTAHADAIKHKRGVKAPAAAIDDDQKMLSPAIKNLLGGRAPRSRRTGGG